jgi:hypothetical protein
MLSTPSGDLTKQSDCDKRANSSVLLLGCMACIVFAASLCSAFLLPQAPGRMAEPSADLIPAWPLWSLVVALPLPIPRQSHWLALALLLTSALNFAAYAGAVYLAWNQPYDRRPLFVVAGVAILLFVVSACALPNVNRDIYNYILSGRVAAVYGANPYFVPPDRFPDDPIFRYASDRYTSYPGDNKLPVWMLLNVVLARLGGDSPVANLLLYRAAFLLFNTANLVLIGRILHTLQPRLLLAGLLLYGWNPIVVAHGQSKVDTVMVFFMLLAALAIVRDMPKLAAVALGMSALVKLITLPLLAVYWLYLLRFRSARRLAASTLLLGLTAIAVYVPFWYGPELLTIQLGLLENVADTGPDLGRLLLYTGFALGVLWVGLSRDGRVENILSGWALVLAPLALFLTKLGFSWYLMTLIAAAGLVVERRLALIVIALSFASFLLNAWDSASNEIMQMPRLFPAPRFYMQLLFACACGLGLAALEIVRRLRRRHDTRYGVEQR